MIGEVELLEPKKIISHEFDMRARTMKLTASADSSPGADGVMYRGNKMAVVDGVGRGVAGKRQDAEKLAEKLLSTTEPLDDRGAYVSLSYHPEEDILFMRARGGGYLILWNDDGDGVLKPQAVHAGKDTHGSKPVQKAIDTSKTKYMCAMTDGGLGILSHEELFGELPGYAADRDMTEVIKLIELGVYPDTDMIPRIIETKLLPPITNLLNTGKDFSHMHAGVMKFLSNAQDKIPNLHRKISDDATLTLTCIGKRK